jgi:hypothetical protein
MRRGPVAWLVLVLASLVLSGCTFSFGGSTEVTESGQEAADGAEAPGASGSAGKAPDRKPAQPTPTPPHVSALGDRLTAVYLTDISDAKSAASIVNDWVRVTAIAPASLKGDLTTVGGYLVAAAKGDDRTLKNASDMVGKALDHIDAYVTRVCRA